MKVITPYALTDATLFSSSVAENDHTTWSAATAYTLGARVIRTTTHRIYERLVAGTTAAAPEADDLNWLDVGPTARWAMFDESPSTLTSGASPLSVYVTPGAVNDIVLHGVVGTQVQIYTGSTGATLLRTVAVTAPVAPATSSTVVITGLAIAAGNRIGVVLTGSGTVSCAWACFGTFADLGLTLYPPQIGITDYSAKETDDFGVTRITRRAYSRKLQTTCRINTADTDRVTALLENLRGRVAWWHAVDGYACLQVMGYYKDWSIDLRGAVETTYSLTVEGLAYDDVVIYPGQVVSGVTASGGLLSSSATVFLFQRTATPTAPAAPSAPVGYAFDGGATTGLTNGWTPAMPTTGGAYRWVITANAFSNTDTASIAAADWSPASLLAQDGSIVDGTFSAVTVWDFTGSANGWSADNQCTFTLDTNALVVASTGADPFFASPGTTLDGARYDKVRARVKRLAGAGWQGALYYATAGHSWSEFFAKYIPDTTANAAGYVVLEWDMAALTAGGADWTTNTILRLRFDLGNTAADQFAIDWIAVGRYGPVQLGELGFTGALNANYTTNTNQLVDGAGLGTTAAWSGVSNRPKSFRVTAYGYDSTTIPSGGAGLFDGETGVTLSGSARSYMLVRIRRSDGVVTSTQFYDVIGSGGLSAGRNAATLAADLNATGPDSIVVVYTLDEPQGNRLTGGLDAAMYRCGASRAVFGSPQFRYRSAYILVGIGGCGEGNGFEAYQGSVDNDTNAWCDAAFSLQNGNLTVSGASYTPRSLVDYGYVGDLNATNGATFGVNVNGQAGTNSIAQGAVTNGVTLTVALPQAATPSFQGDILIEMSYSGFFTVICTFQFAGTADGDESSSCSVSINDALQQTVTRTGIFVLSPNVVIATKFHDAQALGGNAKLTLSASCSGLSNVPVTGGGVIKVLVLKGYR